MKEFGIIGEMLILSGFAAFNLTKLKRAVGKYDLILWGILCGGSTLLMINQMWDQASGRVSVIYLWECMLSYFGFVVIHYARRYEKRMLGLYALIMDVISLLTIVITSYDKKMESLTIMQQMITIVTLLGYSSVTVLCCLGLVARKRPAKVKRWLRISFLTLGAAILLDVFGIICIKGQGPLWNINGNMVLITWLVLCSILHRKKVDTRWACVLPFVCVVVGMVVRYEARLLLAALVGGGIGAFLVSYKQSLVGIPKFDLKDMRTLFRLITYAYAALLCIGTGISFLTDISIWRPWFDAVTICYLVLVTAFLVTDQPKLSHFQYAAIAIWNTAITLVGMLFIKGGRNYSILLVWIYLFPITCAFFQQIKALQELHRLKHLMSSILLIGVAAVICGNLGGLIYAFFIGGVGVLAGTIYCLFFGNL